MFDRFVRLAQARKALQDGQFEDALRLVDDPLVRGHRKADVLRRKAVDGLVSRAERRADAGGLSAALRDCDRALGLRPDHGRALSLRDALRQRAEDGEGRVESVRSMCRDGRRALERGEVGEAEALVAAARAVEDHVEVSELAGRVAVQKGRAAELMGAAIAARRDGRLENAAEVLSRARALDVGLPGAEVEAGKLAKAIAPQLRVAIEEAFASGGASAARAVWTRRLAVLPELAGQSAPLDALRRVDRDGRRKLVDLLDAGDLEGAVELCRSRNERAPGGLAQVVEQLGRALSLAQRGELRDAADLTQEVADDLGIDGLEQRAASWRRAAEQADRQLHRAREEAAEGRLVDARATLLEVVAEHPGHARARREMELLDQGAEDRARRMTEARGAGREGRLREAAALVVTLAVPGPEGDEARILLRDLQQRMDTVGAGIRQVLRAMHGRDSASREGLQHCARRLEELEKVQGDSEELRRLKDAIGAEVDGLDRIGEGGAALRAADPTRLRTAFEALADGRERLLAADRLDARILEIVDDVLVEAERSVAAGCPVRAERLLAAVRVWLADDHEAGQRLAEIDARIAERRVRAAHHVIEAEAAMDQRDASAAEKAVEQARDAAADEPSVVRLDAALEALRRREERIEEVEGMAGQRDFDAAQRELGKLGPTPSLMRTRIYDLKRNLARAQGLDGSFLLRVDEGGEFLVVRGESLTVGNLRDGSSDLPMLANLAGRHARLRRTLSFHGGQEDRIEAERGEIFVRGQKVESTRLTSGLRVRLGESVELLYRLPSERSLTSILSIRGGFQIGGTDTIFWMKDRGRDGRVLVGPTSDCHVQVERATSVVEIYAGRDGQVRVCCEAGGDIDGKPFQGEHPATAGAVVSCAGLSFVLQPWAAR